MTGQSSATIRWYRYVGFNGFAFLDASGVREKIVLDIFAWSIRGVLILLLYCYCCVI